MAIPNFKFKVRNVVDADETRVCEIYDTDDDFYGKFYLKFYDTSSIAWSAALQKRLDRLTTKERRVVTHPRTPDERAQAKEFNLRFFIEEYMTDSEIPSDDPKAQYKHDVDTLVAYFTHPQMGFVLDGVYSFAGDVVNYRREAEEDAKNA